MSKKKSQTTHCINPARDCDKCSGSPGCTKKVHCSCGGKQKDCRKCNGCGWRHPDGHSSTAYQGFHGSNLDLETRLAQERLKKMGILE